MDTRNFFQSVVESLQRLYGRYVQGWNPGRFEDLPMTSQGIYRGADELGSFAVAQPARGFGADVWAHGGAGPQGQWLLWNAKEQELTAPHVLRRLAEKQENSNILLRACNPGNNVVFAPAGTRVTYGLGTGVTLDSAAWQGSSQNLLGGSSFATGIGISEGKTSRLYMKGVVQSQLKARGISLAGAQKPAGTGRIGLIRAGDTGQVHLTVDPYAVSHEQSQLLSLPLTEVPAIEARRGFLGRTTYHLPGGEQFHDLTKATKSLMAQISGPEAASVMAARGTLNEIHVNLESKIGQFLKRVMNLPFLKHSRLDVQEAAVQAFRTFQQAPAHFLTARSQFSGQETEALTRYKGFGFTSINTALRTDPATLTTEGRQTVNTLDVLTHAGTVETPFSVHRGWSGRGLDPTRPLVGQEFTDPGFTSTSLNPYVPEDFAKKPGAFTAEVRLPKGSKGFLLASHETWRGSDKEAEFLLPRGTKFRVLEEHAAESAWRPRHLVLEAITPEHIPTPLQLGQRVAHEVHPTVGGAAAAAERIAAKGTVNELHTVMEGTVGQFLKKLMRIPLKPHSQTDAQAAASLQARIAAYDLSSDPFVENYLNADIAEQSITGTTASAASSTASSSEVNGVEEWIKKTGYVRGAHDTTDMYLKQWQQALDDLENLQKNPDHEMVEWFRKSLIISAQQDIVNTRSRLDALTIGRTFNGTTWVRGGQVSQPTVAGASNATSAHTQQATAARESQTVSSVGSPVRQERRAVSKVVSQEVSSAVAAESKAGSLLSNFKGTSYAGILIAGVLAIGGAFVMKGWQTVNRAVDNNQSQQPRRYVVPTHHQAPLHGGEERFSIQRTFSQSPDGSTHITVDDAQLDHNAVDQAFSSHLRTGLSYGRTH